MLFGQDDQSRIARHAQAAQQAQREGDFATAKPDLVSALIFSGIANYELSKPAQATKLLERAARLSQADPLAHTWLAYPWGVPNSSAMMTFRSRT